MCSSGTTAISTNGADPVTLLDPRGSPIRNLVVINEGAVAGFVNFGGGILHRIPATTAVVFQHLNPTVSIITIQRDGAADMSGVYASAW